MSVSAPAGTEFTGAPLGRSLQRQTPEQMASKMLAEKNDLNSRTRLSWNQSKVPISGEGKFVGDVCLSLPYVNIERKYFIQNCRVFLSNGDETTLAKVFELEAGGPRYLTVASALEQHLKDAIVHDPGLCKHCTRFRSDAVDVMMQHLIDEHPDVLVRMTGTKAPEPETDIEKPWCESCDRTFKNESGLRLHRLKTHDKVA